MQHQHVSWDPIKKIMIYNLECKSFSINQTIQDVDIILKIQLNETKRLHYPCVIEYLSVENLRHPVFGCCLCWMQMWLFFHFNMHPYGKVIGFPPMRQISRTTVISTSPGMHDSMKNAWLDQNSRLSMVRWRQVRLPWSPNYVGGGFISIWNAPFYQKYR